MSATAETAIADVPAQDESSRWRAATATPPLVGAAAVARPLDAWVLGIFSANLLHALLFAWAYPQHRYDTDLMAYLVYFRNWASGDASLFGVRYFMHPKALLVFTLGPLGSATAAFYCSAVASAVLGSLVYAISRDHFGRTVALLVSAFLLLDPSKAFLTLKSSADVYVALFLFAGIWLCERDRLLQASLCVLLAALVKPVALPCAAYFLAQPLGGRRRWIAAALPALALPITLWANDTLLGSVHAADRFFEEFTALRGGDSIGPDGVLHFALWTQLVKQQRFAATSVWGLIGLAMWLGGDRRRLTSPLFLVPLLYLSGFVLLSLTSHFMPFFRFFWTLDIWFLMFLVYGAVEGARRLAGNHAWVQAGVAGFALLLLVDAGLLRQIDYRRDIALTFENGMQFAASAAPTLHAQYRDGQHVLTPIALLPYFMWEFPDAARAQAFATTELAAMDADAAKPDWIVYVPKMNASAAAQEWVPTLIRDGGYELVASDGNAGLYARPQTVMPAVAQ